MPILRDSPVYRHRCRRYSVNYTWLVATFLLFFAFPSRSLAIAAALPASQPDSYNSTVQNHAQAQLGSESTNRQQLIKRHEQISTTSVAAGFVHPTDLYRRDAEALPPPDKAFNLTVTQDLISPDGFQRLGFLMNGKYPADPLIWDENDDVEITVYNESPVPFAIHWHGIHQIGSPEMDGVPGLSQWNIYTGESYTYRFKLVNQYGGYWYHSHERGYYADGLRGTIYVRPKSDRKKPWSLISIDNADIGQMEAAESDFQVMSLSDHWHINHTDMLLVVHETGVPPACFDSLLINGRGRQYCMNDWRTVMSPIEVGLLHNFSSINPTGVTSKGCISLVPPKPGYTVKDTLDTRYGGVCQNTSAPLTVFSATKALKEGRRWLNLQIIDTATNWYYGVSIDSHKMWIVAVDGHYIEPMQVDWAQITIGSRLSVMVELDPEYHGNIFPIRLTGARALQPIEGHAFLSYVDELEGTWDPEIEEDFAYALRELTTAHVPYNGFVVDPTVVKWQQNLSKPFDPISRVPESSNMTLHAVASQNSLNVWQLASVPLDTAHLADERPMLFNATDGDAISNQMTPYAVIPFGTVVDIIMENNIYSIVGGPNSPHPFHMHSRRFWIIGSGAGPFPADTVAEAEGQGILFNYDAPPLRDGFDIDANSWVVIRYIADHAAANILHCHIDDHAIEGMAAVLLEGLETIPAGGNFSEQIKARPANWVETQNDQLGQVLEESWSTGIVNAKWIEPAATETSTPWGDPRALAMSIQLLASSNSVQQSITSSLQAELSMLQATATEPITAITATVFEYVTTFTGAAASSDAVASASPSATATAGAPATGTVADSTVAATAAATDGQESTLIAAASTLPLASSSAHLDSAYRSMSTTASTTRPPTSCSVATGSQGGRMATETAHASVVAYSTLYHTVYDSTATATYAAESLPVSTLSATQVAMPGETASPATSPWQDDNVDDNGGDEDGTSYVTADQTKYASLGASTLYDGGYETSYLTAAGPPSATYSADATYGQSSVATDYASTYAKTTHTIDSTLKASANRAASAAAVTTKLKKSTLYTTIYVTRYATASAAASNDGAAATLTRASALAAATLDPGSTFGASTSTSQAVVATATDVASSTLNPADYGTYSATATYTVDPTLDDASYATITAPATATTIADDVDDSTLDDVPYETYLSE